MLWSPPIGYEVVSAEPGQLAGVHDGVNRTSDRYRKRSENDSSLVSRNSAKPLPSFAARERSCSHRNSIRKLYQRLPDGGRENRVHLMFILHASQLRCDPVRYPGRGKLMKRWSHPPGLNRRPADYESAALPTELGWPVFVLNNLRPGPGGSLDSNPFRPQRFRF